MTLDVLALGAAAGGLAVLVRAFPWPEAWKTRKPLGCPTCLSAWCALAVVAAESFAIFGTRSIGGGGAVAASWLAATGIAAVVLAIAAPMPTTFDLTTANVVDVTPQDRCAKCDRPFEDDNNDRRFM